MSVRESRCPSVPRVYTTNIQSRIRYSRQRWKLKGQSLPSTFVVNATNNRFPKRAYGERAMIVWSEVEGGEGWRASSAVRTSRFDEFRRNGRREVGNFAAQERNYGSKRWLAIGLAPPIWTERRGHLSFRRVVDDMRLPPTACRQDLIKALIGKWRDLIGPSSRKATAITTNFPPATSPLPDIARVLSSLSFDNRVSDLGRARVVGECGQLSDVTVLSFIVIVILLAI